MKRFLATFFGVLFLCIALVAAGIGLSVFASFLSDILPPKDKAVNNGNEKKALTVIIDPGHGGMDGGAVGVNGILEKDLNLDLAKKLGAALKERNIAVMFTRTEDVMLEGTGNGSAKNADLRARVNLVQNTENALLVSIHMNKFPDASVKGITFYYSENHPESKILAGAMQKEIKERLQADNKRPMKGAGTAIYLLHRVTCPAVLVECGFISNAYEAALLSSEEYRATVAGVLADSIQRYIDEKEKDTTIS